MNHCKHADFLVGARVNTFNDMPGVVLLEISGHCVACGEDITFSGVPVGLSFDRITRDFKRTTLNVPATVGTVVLPERMPSFFGPHPIPVENSDQ